VNTVRSMFERLLLLCIFEKNVPDARFLHFRVEEWCTMLLDGSSVLVFDVSVTPFMMELLGVCLWVCLHR
jgi:hypothetical protein